jgi:hypothetical protein
MVSYLKRLKRLEQYLDFGIASLLTSTSSADWTLTLIGHNKTIGYRERFMDTYNATDRIGMLEQAEIADYLISKTGLIPGVAVSALMEVGIYMLIGYGMYKLADILFNEPDLLEGSSRIKKFFQEIKFPLIERVPSYTFVLLATYIHMKGIESWLKYL